MLTGVIRGDFRYSPGGSNCDEWFAGEVNAEYAFEKKLGAMQFDKLCRDMVFTSTL